MSAARVASLALPGRVGYYVPSLAASMVERHAYAMRLPGEPDRVAAFGNIASLGAPGIHPIAIDPAAILGAPTAPPRPRGKRCTVTVVIGMDPTGAPVLARVVLEASVDRVTRAIRAARGCP